MSRKSRARQVALATVMAAVGLAAAFAWLQNIPSTDDAAISTPAIAAVEPALPSAAQALSVVKPVRPAADAASEPASGLAPQPVRPPAPAPLSTPSTPSRPGPASSAVPVPAPAPVPAARPDLAAGAAPAASPAAAPASPTGPAAAPAAAPASPTGPAASLPAASAPAPATTSVSTADRLAAGRAAFERLGCTRCHSIAGRGSPANPLDGIGQRRDLASIRDWVLGDGDAKASLSPSVLRAKARAQGDPDLDALVEYLGQLGR